MTQIKSNEIMVDLKGLNCLKESGQSIITEYNPSSMGPFIEQLAGMVNDQITTKTRSATN